jgi:hypothetical protein
MKVGIITQYYKSSNYGGLLQAYALLMFLKKKGYDCEQICYNFYSSKKNKSPSLSKSLSQRGIIKSFLVAAKRFLIDKICAALSRAKRKISIRIESCRDFRENVICHSDRVYDDNSISECQSYDALITGSDQVWLCNVKNLHPGFWLSFANKKVKKISYAASVSMNEIPVEFHDFIRHALDSFNAISVRESSDVKLIGDIIGKEKEIIQVLDPTLLLERIDWFNLCAPNPYRGRKYVFAYLLGAKKEDRAFIRKFAKKEGLEIVFIPYMQNKYRSCDLLFGDIRLYDVSPQLFLSLIRDASCVITDSFHGTVFSNIFHVNFLVLKRNSDASKKSMNSRLYSLLNMLKMEDRLVSNDFDEKMLKNMSMIDFDTVDAIIEQEKKKSETFLDNALRC